MLAVPRPLPAHLQGDARVGFDLYFAVLNLDHLMMAMTLGLLLHAGHGSTEPTGILHFLTEPVHLGVGLSILAAGAFLATTLVRRRSTRT